MPMMLISLLTMLFIPLVYIIAISVFILTDSKKYEIPSGGLWVLLSIFLPVVGPILYLIYRNDKKELMLKRYQ